jgi:acyl-CoA thioesterase II
VQTSVNHSVLFHEPAARADEWMVSERSASWAADGRVLVEQRFWSRDTGRLVLTCWQEGLVRVNKASL